MGLIPAATAVGTASSRKAWSGMAAEPGVQRTVITFWLRPVAFICPKNAVPPSAAYLPVSSFAPKSTAEAVVAKVSAHASASAVVSFFKLPALVEESGVPQARHRPFDGRVESPLSPIRVISELHRGAGRRRSGRGRRRAGPSPPL